jgi:RimJ/RimL family protein N-acetyltransferase
MQEPPRLTDGVAVLRPLDLTDIDAHLAGEDDALIRWLNGGPGSRDGVERHIRACQESWLAGGPTFTFGIRAGDPERLCGTIDAHLALAALEPGQANLAYGLYPHARGRGLATRAVGLMCDFLTTQTGVREVVIRAEPGNAPSTAVALRAGFRLTGRDPDGLDRYVRRLHAGSAALF